MKDNLAKPLEESAIRALEWADWLVLVLYICMLLVIAWWAMPKIKNCGGFFVGSRKMGKLLMIAASFAGGTNANHPVAVAAATFQKGMAGVWLSLTWILITPFFWMFPPVMRRLRIVTLADVVRMRFGGFMSAIFKAVQLITAPISLGLGIKSAVIVLEVMSGGSVTGWQAEAIIVIPTIIYTLMGGVIAAYVTDVYQGILIIILSFLLIPFAIIQAGGIESVDARIDDRFTSLFNGTGGEFGFWWIFWFAIGITFSATLSAGGGAAAAKDEMASRAKLYGLVIKRFCTVGWGLVGLLGIALFAGHPVVTPDSGFPGASPDNVFALASSELLPVVLRGVMVASILAAVMSSLASGMLNFSSTFVNNVYQEHIIRNASSSHYLVCARVMALVGVVIGWIIATGIQDIVEFSTIVEALNSLTGIAILAAIMWRRVTAAGAIASVFVAAPLFLAVSNTKWPNFESLSSGFSLFQAMGLTPVAVWLGNLYGMNILDPALGYVDANGILSTLPVQIKYPMYIVPAVLALIIFSLLTKQHNLHAVNEFYCRLDTPVGQEHKIAEAGYQIDELARLDRENPDIKIEPSVVGQRLLLSDLFRLPMLLKTGQAKLSDYKWDWIGIVGSILFVVLFLYFVEWLGSHF